jgi:hypothetical protein
VEFLSVRHDIAEAKKRFPKAGLPALDAKRIAGGQVVQTAWLCASSPTKIFQVNAKRTMEKRDRH